MSIPKKLAPLCVRPNHSIRDAIQCIDRNAKGIALVIDEGDHLIGTITDGDIRRRLLKGHDLDQSIKTILAKHEAKEPMEPVVATVGTSDADLLHLMNEHGYRHIPVVDESKRVVDIAFLSDLARTFEPQLRAVVMAGGFGTRLRPLTSTMPKSMLPLGGKPIIEHTINKLKDAGIRRIDVATHFQADKISEYLGDGNGLGVDISYVREEKPLGTAGALGLLNKSTDPLLIINGDILTELNFSDLMTYHREQKADLTVSVRKFDISVPYGVIECEDGSEVKTLREKPIISLLANAGIYLMEPRVRDLVPENVQVDMTELIQRLIDSSYKVSSFLIREYWLDIGTQENYDTAKKYFDEK